MLLVSLYIAYLAFVVRLVDAQHVGTSPDKHPALATKKCTKAGGCVTLNTYVVLDSLSHPVYQADNTSFNCGDWGEPADPTACPDLETCQKRCKMDGIQNYTAYGVKTSGGTLDLNHIVDGKVVSPRVYLLAPEKDRYEMLKVLGGEVTVDIDMSKLPCGMNAAICLNDMAADGGQSAEPLNQAGAQWGTGYCDAQCFTTPFVNGVGNLAGDGICCNEMDIWEANSRSTMVTPHVCAKEGPFTCKGAECDFNGVCDEWGCQFNTYRNGAKSFYGAGREFSIDTNKPFSVVTQFPVNKSGLMENIIRFYIQDRKIVYPPNAKLTSVPNINYQNDEYCDAISTNRFNELGGMKIMGESLARGAVLIFSVWWDPDSHMSWLDQGESGPCNATEGDPKNIVLIEPSPRVRYSNIKWGEINSTFTT